MNHCPEHKRLRLVEFPVRVGKKTRQVWACPVPTCGYLTVVPPKRALNPNRRLGIVPRERKQVVLQERESDVSKRIEERFEVHGYKVLVTSEHRKKVECADYKDGYRVAGCGRWFFPNDGTGVDKGIPDIFVHHPHRYPPYCWLGIEVKGPTTEISDAQRAFGAALGYVIAHGDEEAWQAIMWAESIMETAMIGWRQDCVEILVARQAALDAGPAWERDRLAWLLEEREQVKQIGRQTMARLDAEIKALQGES